MSAHGSYWLLASLLWVVNTISMRLPLPATPSQSWQAEKHLAPQLASPGYLLLSGQHDGSPFYAWDQNKRKTLSPFPFRVKCRSRCWFSPVVSSQQNHPLSMWQQTQGDFENRMREGSWLLLEPTLSRGPSHPWLPNIHSSTFPAALSGRKMLERSLVGWPKDQGTP